MEEEIKMCLDEAKEGMENALEHTKKALTKIRAGKASPEMLDGLMVDYYGAPTPIAQVANISAPEPRMIVVKPWEKSMLAEVERAVRNSDLGLNPMNDGTIVRLPIPMLSEDRRRDLVKRAKNEGENGKISIRQSRQEANEMLRSLQKEGAPEDAVKRAEEEVQNLTNAYSAKVEELLKAKEADIMTV